jgi:HPt (histidine-containing phosphotransfer) domain-containing protein
MDGFLSKPVLLEDLRAALSRGAGARGEGPAVPAPPPAAGSGDGEESFDPKYIDQLRQLQRRSGRELVSPVIDRFLTEAPLRIAELRRALAARDDHNFVFVAHTLKGSCAQLGARRLAEICCDLEMRGRRVEWSGMEEIVGHLQSEIELLAPRLRAAREGAPPEHE